MKETASPKQKLYCYVDETGQDTYGKFFIVSVVITDSQREKLLARLEQIEKTSGKGNVKWIKSRPALRLAYIKAVLSDPIFKRTLHYVFSERSKKYMVLTVIATAQAVATAPKHQVAAVYVDGLPKPRIRWFGTELRHLGVHTSKVVGVRKEESDPLIRLADACCGFVRQALMETDSQMKTLFDRAVREGYLKKL